MTGGKVITKDKEMKLEDADVSHLGTCEELIVNKNETIMMHGKGSLKSIQSRAK